MVGHLSDPGNFVLDVAYMLYVVSMVRRYFGNAQALELMRKLIKEEDMVNSEAYIKENLELKVPVVILTSFDHIDSRLLPALMKTGVSRDSAAEVQGVALRAFQAVRKGNGFAYYHIGYRGSLAIIGVPPKSNKYLLRHEMGHLMDQDMGTRKTKILNLERKRFLLPLSYLSRLYSKHATHGIEHEEIRAWDLADVPKDNKLRKAALKSYSTSYGFHSALLKLILTATFSSQLKKWIRGIVSKLEDKAVSSGKGFVKTLVKRAIVRKKQGVKERIGTMLRGLPSLPLAGGKR